MRTDRRWLGLPLRALARLVAVTMAAGLALAVLAAVALVGRELPVPDEVRRLIETRAAAVLGGGSVTFGAATVRLDRDLHPWLTLGDAMLRDADGTPLATFEALRVGVSPRGLILERRALVQQVTLSGFAAELARDEAGRFALAFDATGGGDPLFARGIGGLVDRVDRLRRIPALEALTDLRAEDIDVTLLDARADRTWRGTAAFAMNFARDRTTGAARITVEDAARPIDLHAVFDSPTAGPQATLSVELTDLPAPVLSAEVPALAALSLDAPLSAKLMIERTPAGRLAPLTATLATGAGTLAPGAEPLELRPSSLALRFDPGSDRLEIEDLSFEAGDNRLSGRGLLLLERASPSEWPVGAVAQLALEDISVRPGALYPDPVRVAEAFADLRIGFDPVRVDLRQATARMEGDTRLRIGGRVRREATGWTVVADLQSDAIDRDEVLRLWPVRLAKGPREWLSRNLEAGTLSDATLAVRIAPETRPEVGASFAFTDARVRFLPEAPPVAAARGFASLGDGRFDLTLAAGEVEMPEGTLDLAGSTLSLPTLGARPVPLELALAARGQIPAALALLDVPPLRLVEKAGLTPALATGDAAVAAEIALPLKRGLTGADVTFAATGRLTDVQSDRLMPGRRLASDALALTVDRGGLGVEGAASLDGVVARGRFRQAFGPDAAPATVTARVPLSPKTLSTFGIDLPTDLLRGDWRADVTVTLPRGAPPRLTARSDLAGVAMAIPAIGWSKTARATGRLSVKVRLGADPQVEALSLDAPGLRAEGDVRLSSGALRDLRLSRVEIGDWFDGAVTLDGRGAGQAPGVRVQGGTLDLVRADLGGGGGDGSTKGGPLALRLDRLRIAEGFELTDVRGSFDTGGGLRGRFDGAFNGSAIVTGEVSPQAGRTRVRILSEDAGAVLRAGRFLRGASGGRLELTLDPAAGDGAFDGRLAIRELRVRDAPGIASLLDAVSVVGLVRQLDGQGIAFDTVDARFRLDRDRLTVTRSSAVGPGLGISLDGVYRLGAREVDFQGVLSPFYALNGLGAFLTRPGEGLFGANFTLRGPAAAPQVSVNPLSLLTPGMFREIFRRPAPEVAR